jgi:hypothetical protein
VLAARSPAVVERGYSEGLYRAIAAVAARTTGRVPFSLAEWVVAAAVAALVWISLRFAARCRRERGYLRRTWRRAMASVLAAAGATYLAFLVGWGLNYARQPFAVLAGLDTSPARTAELRDACEQLVERANALRVGLPEDDRGVMRLPDGLRGALDRAGQGYREAASVYGVLAGRPARAKPLASSRLFSYLGITGIFFPFTGEANVNADVPDPDIPFAIAHEMAHARGFAREDEAGYVGYLACRFHPDRDFQYSGVLGASIYAANALFAVDRRAHRQVTGARSAAVGRDIEALRQWSDRYQGPVARVSHSVNNAYLKSQGQAEGMRSYGRMVDLLIAERRARPPGPSPRGTLGDGAALQGGT